MENLNNIFERNIEVFNSPLEIGFRILFILSTIFPNNIDISKLTIFDYFLLNSEDLPDGPKSLHPRTPHRSSQILIRPLIIENAIKLMKSKELLEVEFFDNGIFYKANHATHLFVKLQKNEYAMKLVELSKIINERFQNLSEENLKSFITDRLTNWDREFIYESMIRG